MRCTQCGLTEFSEKTVLTREGDKVVNPKAFVCLNCGHIEWYISETELTKLKNPDKSKKSNNPWDW